MRGPGVLSRARTARAFDAPNFSLFQRTSVAIASGYMSRIARSSEFLAAHHARLQRCGEEGQGCPLNADRGRAMQSFL